MTDLGCFTLHGFYRSSASYRVRIALGLKGLKFDSIEYNLRNKEQLAPEYLALNPQGLVPALAIDSHVLTQSLAICEYLDEAHPDPALLPVDPMERARVRAAAYVVACDIHPVQNLKILNRLRTLGVEEGGVEKWARATIHEGLAAFEALLPQHNGEFCFGNRPNLADLCLVPQLANARRFGVSLTSDRILRVEQACLEIEAFKPPT
ncbi:maleylacetoacetate isomerase (plasmid) [Blastomonas sp. RAC04]|uniref:maleylacetoacetate isomerase n=1 Tax=Blastomonas sp. RAC04 TaxID=1842535 RepID=UPI0008555871|nr:maleylacetoacetate isomerase [Blastomonas sp. RAC04]AOF98670.1 maleylacetoacetate isomerase [Blastomonas sp. RAC04]